MHEIDKKIAELDIQAMQDKLKLIPNVGPEIMPRDYQWLAYSELASAIGRYTGPVFVNMSVGAGKTIVMAMIARRFADMGNHKLNSADKMRDPAITLRGLILARQSELISQNSEALSNCGVDNSKFSAGLKAKSVYFPIVAGTEKSVLNGMYKEMEGFCPSFLLIDECLTGDSMIECRDGFYRIDDPELRNKEIKCVSEDGGSTFYHNPVRVFTNGTKPVSCIKLSSGDEITCTGTHRLFSNGSWRRASSLKVGEKLTLCGQRDSFMKKLKRAVVAVVRELCQ